MLCRKCGSTLPENARFCNRCGASVPAQPAPIPMAQPELFDATPLAFTRENGYAPLGDAVPAQEAAEPQPEKKQRKRGWFVALIAVLVLVFSGSATYGVMTLFGGTRLSPAQAASNRLEQTWYMCREPSIVMSLHDGHGVITQSYYMLAEFTYEILDDGHISISTQSKTGEFELTYSDDGTVLMFWPTLFGSPGESWTTNPNATQSGGQGGYRNC